MKKILAYAGSVRRESFNRRLLAAAVSGARAAGAEVTLIELADYPLPLFDEDAETASGLPDNVRRLKQLMRAHDGLLVACPEYNGSITPLLKNLLDWCSRGEPGEPAYAATRGKVVGLMAASDGRLGGLRGLRHVREVYTNLQALVLPEQVALPGAGKLFDAQGQLTDEKLRKQAEALGARVATVLTHWNAS